MPQSSQSWIQLANTSTGFLKWDPHIFHWIVTRVLHPRKGGHSRIDNVKIHLMYILPNKVPMNELNYFTYRMFPIKECNWRSFLCYVSIIANILNHFNIGVANLVTISPGSAQEKLYYLPKKKSVKNKNTNATIYLMHVLKYN